MTTLSRTMVTRIGVTMIAIVALLTTEFATTSAQAQSSRRGTRYTYPPRSTQQATQRGSSRRGLTTNAALNGYCSVCITDMKRWVQGRPDYATEYDGKTYYFPNAKIRSTFLANPAKYVPALGGDCVVCLARMGERVPGTVFFAAFHADRLFLFPGQDQKDMFVEDPAAYANVDLAYGGNCAVCQVEANDEVAGDPEIAAVHNGFRYYFPGEDQRAMFLQDPEKYAWNPEAGQQETSLNSNDTTQLVTVTGKSSCAGCEHGLKPIGSDELGLAVEGTNGRIYVIEDAHELYPEVYRGRFGGQQLQISGTVVKTDGDHTWLMPSSLEVLSRPQS